MKHPVGVKMFHASFLTLSVCLAIYYALSAHPHGLLAAMAWSVFAIGHCSLLRLAVLESSWKQKEADQKKNINWQNEAVIKSRAVAVPCVPEMDSQRPKSRLFLPQESARDLMVRPKIQ